MNPDLIMRRLIDSVRAAGINVVDMRGQVPENPNGKKFPKCSLEDQTGIVVHHGAAERARWDGPTAVASYASWHIDRGFPSIGYRFMIWGDGTLAVLHGLDVASYATGTSKRPGDENAQFSSVCLTGNMKGPHNSDQIDEPTAAQWIALKTLFNQHLRLGIFPGWNDKPSLYGHYHFGKAACPGQDVENWIERTRKSMWPHIRYDWEIVQDRQRALKDAGYYGGKIDGDWGPKSSTAHNSFCAAHGLELGMSWDSSTLHRKLFYVIDGT